MACDVFGEIFVESGTSSKRTRSGSNEGQGGCSADAHCTGLMKGGCIYDQDAMLFRDKDINKLAVVAYRCAPERNTGPHAAELSPGARVEDSELC
jgi:hypothetical protein